MNGFSNPAWRVELQCPQCGAPATLEETDRIFSCPFCRVRHFLAFKGTPRYYMNPATPVSDQMLFIPYWRFRGMIFSCRGIDIQHRIVDSTLLALSKTALPPSLGVRPQVLKLRFVSPETGGSFLRPHLPFTIPDSDPLSAPMPIGSPHPALPRFHEAFIGETLSRIYAPVIVRQGNFFDAILNRAMTAAPEDLSTDFPTESCDTAPIQLVSTLCPRCGWDLQGEKDSLVLLCTNCESAWESEDQGFSAIDLGVAPGDPEEDEIYLPFWRMRAHVQGLTLSSYSELIVLANLPKVPRGADKERDLFFWNPAFKVQPQLYLRLARHLTITQPAGPFEERLPKALLYPVTLPISEAAESIKTTIASLAVPRRHIFPQLPNVTLQLRERMLVYLPFRLTATEAIHTGMQFSINRNSLKFGRLI